ncbi:MAG TPA: DedA family protein [Acidimicrobiia bacterium]|nr:DedA family protein [Acidimicrobiia bacterium]
MIEAVVEFLESLAATPWFMVVVFAIALLDSVIPVVPSETALITGGVAAGFGDLPLVGVIAAGACGAILGDLLAYQVGTTFGSALERKAPERWLDRIAWARKALSRRAGIFLVFGRFIPLGRTVITITSGITRMPRTRFLGYIAIAGVIWSTYAAGLGFLFGRRFQDNHAVAFTWAFATAVGILVAVELTSRALDRRKARV